MKLTTLTIIRGEDWEGIYDWQGRLLQEGHHIIWSNLLRENFGIGVSSKEADEEWLVERGGLPDNLHEVKTKP